MRIETPCELGQEIYTLTDNEPYRIYKYKCVGFKVTAKGKVLPLILYDIPYEIGETAFLTKMEAERKIKEIRERK